MLKNISTKIFCEITLKCEKPYSCQFIKTTFMIHTGGKPHSCKDCNKSWWMFTRWYWEWRALKSFQGWSPISPLWFRCYFLWTTRSPGWSTRCDWIIWKVLYMQKTVTDMYADVKKEDRFFVSCGCEKWCPIFDDSAKTSNFVPLPMKLDNPYCAST